MSEFDISYPDEYLTRYWNDSDFSTYEDLIMHEGLSKQEAIDLVNSQFVDTEE